MRKRKFTKQASVMFDDEMYDLLIKTTNKLEIPISEFIRNIVEKELVKLNKEKDHDEYRN